LTDETKRETTATTGTAATNEKKVKKTDEKLPYPVQLLSASVNSDKKNTENNNNNDNKQT
jgi:hypothetical protein